MVNILGQQEKKDIANLFYKKNYNKTQIALLYSVSPRTIGRVLEEMTEVQGTSTVSVPVTYPEASWKMIITEASVQLTRNRVTRSLQSQALNYKEVVALLVNSIQEQGEAYEQAWELMDAKVHIQKISCGNIEIVGNTIFYKGNEIHNAINEKIVSGVSQGQDMTRYIKFLDNLLENPSKAAVDMLWNFLKHNCISINKDGWIQGYKGVSRDYMDCHSGTFSNQVGETVSMPRNQVQDDPQITCSYGLHVGSLDYAKSFGSRTMGVLLHPKDVVSVPVDYDGQKLRCCSYIVVNEVQA